MKPRTTLLDYWRIGAPVRSDRRMRGQVIGIYDGRDVWVSRAVESLYRDRSDADFWAFLCVQVEVVYDADLNLQRIAR